MGYGGDALCAILEWGQMSRFSDIGLRPILASVEYGPVNLRGTIGALRQRSRQRRIRSSSPLGKPRRE